MVVRCAVSKCTMTTDQAKNSNVPITFHRFPKDDNFQLEWVKKCGWNVNPNTARLCSLHFQASDFDESRDFQHKLTGNNFQRLLKKTAVPTININKEILPRKQETPYFEQKKQQQITSKSSEENFTKKQVEMSNQSIADDPMSNNAALPETSTHKDLKILSADVIAKLCRLCLEENQTMWAFFSVVTFDDGSIIDVSQVFQGLTGEDAEKVENPKLPPYICGHCIHLLTSAHTFQQKYEETTKILNEYLAKESEGNVNDIKVGIHDQVATNKSIETIEYIQDIDDASPQTFEFISTEELSITDINTLPAETKYDILKYKKDPLGCKSLKKSKITNGKDADIMLAVTDEETNSPSISAEEINTATYIKDTTGNPRIFATTPRETTTSTVIEKTPVKLHCCSICLQEFTTLELKKHYHTHKTVKTHVKLAPKSLKRSRIKNRKVADVLVSFTAEETNVASSAGEINTPTTYIKEANILTTENSRTSSTTIEETITVAVTEETSPKLHRCPICPQEFTALELKKHCHTHKTLKTYLKSAPKYNKKVKFYAKPRPGNKGLFNQEKIVHTCPFCQEYFESEPFRDHIKQHRTEGNFRCNICNRIFLGVNHLKTHKLTHKKEAPFKCKFCKKSFFLQANYDFHLLKHSDDNELPFKCEYCLKTFSNPEHLKRHKFSHENAVPYHTFYKRNMLYVQCKQCLQKFKTEEEREVHSCKLCCAKCHKLFDSKSKFKAHVCKNKLKRSQCLPCGKVFLLPSSLKTHKFRCKSRTLCYVCGKNVCNITQHLLTHYPNKRGKTLFKCAQCDKQFTHRPNLARHITEVHSNIVRYRCQYCWKGFKGKWNLQVHERIHTGVKAHMCNICGKGFLEKSYLKKHLRVHLRREVSMDSCEA